MAKQSGLGDQFLVGGYDVSGDIQALSKISGGPATLDVTDITQSAHSRIGGIRDGDLAFTSYFDAAVGAAHPVLKALPTADAVGMYLRGAGVGNPGACLVGKQINYDGTRGNDGSFTFACDMQANGYGLEWGVQLTSGDQAYASFLTGDGSAFEGGIANWTAGTNCSIAQSSAQHHGGTKSLALTSTAGGDMTARHCSVGSVLSNGIAVVPGQGVLVQGWVRSAVSARTDSIGVDFYTSGGSVVGSPLYGTGVADTTSGWTFVTGTVTAPATAAFAIGIVKVASTGAGSEVHYVDDVQMAALPAYVDDAAETDFGAQGYLQVPAFTGTDVTIKVQSSPDLTTWTDLLTFTQVTAANWQERQATSNTTACYRYVRAVAITTAGFTALSFAVVVNVNPIAGVAF